MERQWNQQEAMGCSNCNMRGCTRRARMACQQMNLGNGNGGMQCQMQKQRGCGETLYVGKGQDKKWSQIEENCYCNKRKPVDSMQIGIGYVPWQRFEDLYEPGVALQKGSIFAQLDLPYTGCCGRGKRG